MVFKYDQKLPECPASVPNVKPKLSVLGLAQPPDVLCFLRMDLGDQDEAIVCRPLAGAAPNFLLPPRSLNGRIPGFFC